MWPTAQKQLNSWNIRELPKKKYIMRIQKIRICLRAIREHTCQEFGINRSAKVFLYAIKSLQKENQWI